MSLDAEGCRRIAGVSPDASLTDKVTLAHGEDALYVLPYYGTSDRQELNINNGTVVPRGTLLVAQLVEPLLYKPVDRGFDSRWCTWNFSLT
jgi:hypothetical protein